MFTDSRENVIVGYQEQTLRVSSKPVPTIKNVTLGGPKCFGFFRGFTKIGFKFKKKDIVLLTMFPYSSRVLLLKVIEQIKLCRLRQKPLGENLLSKTLIFYYHCIIKGNDF